MANRKNFFGHVSPVHYGFVIGLGVLACSMYVLELTCPTKEKIQTDPAPETTGYAARDGGGTVTRSRLKDDGVVVSRLLVQTLPNSLAVYQPVQTKRRTLADVLVPHVLMHNEQVLSDRAMLKSLQKIKAAGMALTADQHRFLRTLALQYKMRSVSIDDLLKRVDVIPPSLALSQAVLESGWGGCRHARTQNSPFGMMKNARELIQYDSLQSSVAGYIHNLNTHPAYGTMRQIRSDMRQKDQDLCSLRLADGLLRYSERGAVYTAKIKQLIREHNLKEFDTARFGTKTAPAKDVTA